LKITDLTAEFGSVSTKAPIGLNSGDLTVEARE
jgi:hypothetical protein